MRALGIAIALGLVLASTLPARGTESLVLHEASRSDSAALPQNLVAATLHSDTWLSLEAQYVRRVSLPWPERRILVGADLDLPIFLWADGGRVDAIGLALRGSAEVLRIRWFAVVVDLRSRFGVQDSLLNASLGWNLQLTVAPSLSFERWSLTPFVGVRKGLLTYVRQGQIVKDAFADRYPEGLSGDPGPKDGWLAGGTTRVPFGLAFGVDLPRQVSLYGSGGLVWTRSTLDVGMFDAMVLGHWPFFAELGVSWRL